MDNLLRLRSIWYRQTPNVLKRANAHAERRELSTSVLAVIIQFCRFSDNKNLKVDIHPICPFQLYFIQPIGIYGFKGYTTIISLLLIALSV